MDIKRAWANAITATSNPLAPVILQEAYAKVEQLGKLLARCSDRSLVETFSDKLIAEFTDEELNKYGGKPEFIMALAGLLCTSLVRYGSGLGK